MTRLVGRRVIRSTQRSRPRGPRRPTATIPPSGRRRRRSASPCAARLTARPCPPQRATATPEPARHRAGEIVCAPRTLGQQVRTIGHGGAARPNLTLGGDDQRAALKPEGQGAVHRVQRRREESMTADQSTLLGTDADRTLKAAHRAMWALGDYHRFATATVWELGPVLVEACGISASHRVLDVAAGTGNTAIRAAKPGAGVV